MIVARTNLLGALGLRPGEGRLAAAILAYGFALGIGRSVAGVATSALFLAVFRAEDMAFAYLGTALTVPLTGLCFVWLQGRLPLPRVLGLALGLAVLSLALLRALFAFGGGAAPAMILTIWFTVLYAITTLSFWGLVGRLFNLRQGKRLFGLLSSGVEVAEAVGGLLCLLLVVRLGAPNLLLVAALGYLGAAGVLTLIARRHRADLAAPPASVGEAGAAGLRASYPLLLFALVGLAYCGYFFVDTIFFTLARPHYRSAEAMAGLVGATLAATSSLTVIAQILVAGRLLRRLGVVAGLALLPGAILLGAAAVAAGGVALGPALTVLWLALAMRVVERTLRFSLDESAVQILYQPLAPALRSLAQTAAEGGVKPLAAGLAGAAILIMTRALGLGAVQLALALAAIALVWLGIVLALGRAYPRALQAALDGRRLRGAPLDLRDPVSLAPVMAALRSPRADEARHALELIEGAEHAALPAALLALLDHPAPELRSEALHRLCERGGVEAVPAVTALLARETDPLVRVAATRALTVLGGHADAPALGTDPLDRAPQARPATSSALAAADDRAAHWRALEAEARADDPGRRALAAGAAAALEPPAAAAILGPLLADPDPAVRRAALRVAGRCADEGLWPPVVAALADDTTHAEAAQTLVAAFDRAAPALREAFDRAAPALREAFDRSAGDPRLARRIIRVWGRSTAGAAAVVGLLEQPDEALRAEALRALATRGRALQGDDASHVRGRLLAEARTAFEALLAAHTLGELAYAAPLRLALACDAARATERVLLLLSLLTDGLALRRARSALFHATPEQRAYAVEAIELAAPPELRQVILPLIEELPPDERLSRLARPFGRPDRSATAIIADLAAGTAHPWTRACAVYALAAANPGRPATDEERAMLTIVERVLLLKRVSIFAAIPDDVLSAMAEVFVEEAAPAGATIVRQGELGASAYIIAAGRVRAHTGERTLTILGPGEVFGEIAVLDASARTATVTAEEPTRLLRLEQADLYELTADYVAVTRGIIGTLARYVREAVQQIGDLDLQLHQGRGPDVPPDAGPEQHHPPEAGRP